MAGAAAYGRPGQYNAPLGTDTFIFQDDGSVPNSRLPLIVRQGAITPDASDPASAFERTFAKNGWTKSWRDGIFDYHHYHSTRMKRSASQSARRPCASAARTARPSGSRPATSW